MKFCIELELSYFRDRAKKKSTRHAASQKVTGGGLPNTDVTLDPLTRRGNVYASRFYIKVTYGV